MRALFIVLLALTVPLYAGDRRRPVAVSAPEQLRVSFENVTPSGDLEFTAADRIRRSNSTVERKIFGVRIDMPARRSSGSATLFAHLEVKDARCVVRIDGRTLGITPLLIDAHAAYGSLTQHTLEVETPITAPEGLYSLTIGWEAVQN